MIRVARGRAKEEIRTKGKVGIPREWTKAEMDLNGFMNMKIFTLNSPSDLGNGFKK